MTQPDASRQPDRLDPKLVESLFARLVVRWGRAFMAQYEGVDLEAVKADWARVLARFQREAILYALDNLPAKPMNVEEFRILCRGYRAPEVKRLEAPVGQPPAAVRDAMGKLAEPIKDTRPERVRVAQRYIGKWGTPGVLLSPYQRANLEHLPNFHTDVHSPKCQLSTGLAVVHRTPLQPCGPSSTGLSTACGFMRPT